MRRPRNFTTSTTTPTTIYTTYQDLPFPPVAQVDYLLPPEHRRDEGQEIEKLAYAEQEPNKHGVIPRYYETAHASRWVQYECGNGCANMFWMRAAPSQVRSCRQRNMHCTREREPGIGGSPQLQLLGKVYGHVEVVGHVRGEGWKIRCRCGRERTLINGTALKNGAYSTCGKCTEGERTKAQISREIDKALGITKEQRRKTAECAGDQDWEHEKICFAQGIRCPLCADIREKELLREELLRAISTAI